MSRWCARLVIRTALCEPPRRCRHGSVGFLAKKITAKKAAPDVYSLSFDDTEVALEGNDLKTLLIQITRLLRPAGELAKSGDERRKEFLRHIKNADDVGLQKFLLAADHEDVLILLKVAEHDKALLKKFYGNMSDRSRKICIEDLIFKYKDGVSAAQVAAVIGRLGAIAKDFENEGTLIYENVVKR